MRARANFLSMILTIALVAVPAGSYAEEVETEISSDTLEYQRESGTYVLKGNVSIKKGDMNVSADESEFNENTSEATLRGNVSFGDKEMTVTSDSAELNLKTETGKIHNGSILIKKDNMQIVSDEMEKTGNNSYQLKRTKLTSCDSPVPAWCFSASSANVLVGKRLTARNVVFRIKNIPVLYTPYLWAPILTDRQTGLLFPEFGYKSDLGSFYRQPLFVVLSDNRDATIRADYYSSRGFGQGLEYRYIERGGIEGQWWAYHMGDDKLETDFFLLRSEHFQYKESGLSHFLKLDLVNMDNFYKEYGSEAQPRIQRYLTSSMSAYYTSRDLRAHITGQFWQDLQGDDGNISHKLPTMGLFIKPLKIGPAITAIRAEATNFYSEDSHRVRRYQVKPEVSSSIGNSIRLHQRLSAVGTMYEVSNDPSFPSTSQHGSINYNIAVVPYIAKKFKRFYHVIEPELGYAYTDSSDLDAPFLDSYESIPDRSDIFISLTNKLLNKKGTIFSFRLMQPYDTDDTDRPWKMLGSDLHLNYSPFMVRLEADYDHYDRSIMVVNSDAHYSLNGFKMSAGQRYDRATGVQFYTGGLSFRLSDRLSFINSIWYDEKATDEKIRDLSSSVIYTAQCWGLTLTYTKKPDDYSITAMFNLKGIGYIGSL